MPETLTFILPFFHPNQVTEADANRRVWVVQALNHALTGEVFLGCLEP